MIFVCVGSRDYQFDRLIKKVDELCQNGLIKEHVVMQIGESNYVPKSCEYYKFIDKQKFDEYQDNASIIISHGGTGALIGALKKGKQVISVPRLSRFGEHIDDHQMQVSTFLEEMGYIKMVVDIDGLINSINDLYIHPIDKKYNRPSNVIKIIEQYISDNT